MVAVKTGFTPPPMPGMPAPMQSMGGIPPMPPMPPMGGGALAPNPFAPMPPMPLAGMPPPPMRPPMAQPPMAQQIPQQQQISNAPRRKRFGDSLEGMLGRNMFAPQQRRPLPMPPQMMQQRMVAPGTPMMKTPTPRPMNQGGIVQGFAPGGVVQAIMDNYGYSEAEAQAMYDSATSNVSNIIDSDIAEAYADSLAAVQGDIAARQANIIPNAVAEGILTEEQAQAAIDASKANILAQAEALKDSGDSPFVDVVTEEGGVDYTSPEVIAETGGIFGEEPYTTHYGVNRPAYMDALAAAKAALAAPPAPEPEAAAPAPAPAPQPAPAPEPAPAPTPAAPPTAAEAGPGTAVGAPANFGTGVYAPAPVNPSEINPIDYTQFTGDVGNFSGTLESSALYGPKLNIGQSVSQYYTSPVTGKLTTTAGPEMVATSPIGAIKLPPRPVDIDIFDFLSSPTYGSLLGDYRDLDYDNIKLLQMGGAVQGFANGGNANQQAAASMMAAGIGNVGGKAITSGAQSVQDRFSAAADRRKKRRRKRQARLAAERAAAEQAIRDAEAAALAASQAAQQNNPNIAGPMESALQNFGGTAFQSAASSPAAPSPTDITPEVFIPEVDAASTAEGFMNIEKPDRILDRQAALFPDLRDDDPAFTQGIVPSEVIPENPFTYNIGAIGLGDNRDDTQANLGAGTDPSFPKPQRDPYTLDDLLNLEVGMNNAAEGFRDAALQDLGIQQAEFPALPGNRGFTPSGAQIAPEAATTTGFSYFPSDTRGVMPPVIREKDDSFAESMFEFTPNPYAVGGGFDVTAPRETDEGTRFAYPKDKPLVPTPEDKFGNQPLNRTGVDPQADQYRSSVNAAEAAYLQEALGNMKDPNFAEQVINKIIRNLTLGMFDPDDPQKRADAKAILKAYQDTGKFVYDTEENAIDLSTEEGLKQLEELTKGAGIEPAVIGVRDKEGNVVDFDDGTGFRNIMGDFDYKKGIGSDTQNILTGSTDVFGDGDTATTITTGGGDSGSDTTGDVDLGHTVDEDGNIVCNTPGYIYNPETKICELPKEEDTGSDSPKINIGTAPVESFDDVLKRVVVAAPPVAPISANVRPMQEGGMAGLNRAADNFLKALAG